MCAVGAATGRGLRPPVISPISPISPPPQLLLNGMAATPAPPQPDQDTMSSFLGYAVSLSSEDYGRPVCTPRADDASGVLARVHSSSSLCTSQRSPNEIDEARGCDTCFAAESRTPGRVARRGPTRKLSRPQLTEEVSGVVRFCGV